MSVENETPQEGGGTSHSEEAHAERAASANAFVEIYFNLYRSNSPIRFLCSSKWTFLIHLCPLKNTMSNTLSVNIVF